MDNYRISIDEHAVKTINRSSTPTLHSILIVYHNRFFNEVGPINFILTIHITPVSILKGPTQMISSCLEQYKPFDKSIHENELK